jgi:enoyl-CoA hydratase/carnithine racemase
MHFETILYEVTPDKVATITINRPEALNSFTLQMRREFEQAWASIREDSNVHAVVLRAAEGRAFSTGVDVKVAATENIMGSDNLWNGTDPGDSLGPRANKVWKPVITAVHGLCCGGAFYWLNESDIIICSDDAQFFDPHVSYGLVCAVEPIGMSYHLPLQQVLRIALLGNDERINADTALRIGLVSEVLPKTALWERAHALAAKIAAKPPTAVQGSVRAIWESLELPRTEALNHGLRYCLVGNPVAAEEMDVATARAADKRYEVR